MAITHQDLFANLDLDGDGLLTREELGRAAKRGDALLVIDPQRSFTSGAWMRSIGPAGRAEVAPIQGAFQACASLLGRSLPELEGWLEQLVEAGRTTLVLAGCTLSSCVRVSALEVQRLMGGIGGLQVVVDRALCGARRSNYYSSQEFGGRSSVEAAIQEMEGEGVRVVTGFFQP